MDEDENSRFYKISNYGWTGELQVLQDIKLWMNRRTPKFCKILESQRFARLRSSIIYPECRTMIKELCVWYLSKLLFSLLTCQILTHQYSFLQGLLINLTSEGWLILIKYFDFVLKCELTWGSEFLSQTQFRKLLV